MIRKHGGNVVQNPGPKTFLCIADNDKSLRVKGIIEKEQYNIATVEWLVRSFGIEIPLEKPPKLHPLEMVYATSDLRQRFSEEFDRFGDSYTELMSRSNLVAFLDRIPIDSLPVYTANEINELEIELSSPKMFRLLTAFFDPAGAKDDSYFEYEFAKILFKMNGGKVVNNMNGMEPSANTRLTHVFVNENKFDRTELMRLQETKIFSFRWILKCHEAQESVDERDFLVALE